MVNQSHWLTTLMECDKCAYKWTAVHPIQPEYLECPVCRCKNPVPAVPTEKKGTDDLL